VFFFLFHERWFQVLEGFKEGVALPWLTFGVAGENGGGMGAGRAGDVCAKGARGR